MIEQNGQRYQLSFMPWAGLEEEISVGPVKFCPFGKLAKSGIDSAIYSWIENYFQKIANKNCISPDTISICWKDDLTFKPTHQFQNTDLENLEMMQDAANALYFSKVFCQLQAFHNAYIENAQIYELITITFNPCNKWVISESGGMITTPFIKPSSSSLCNDFDRELLNGFGKFLTDGDSESKRRIFRSLKWFWFAHVRADYFRYIDQVVMMATTFEILSKISGTNKSLIFAEYIDKIIPSKRLKKHIKKLRIHGKHQNIKLSCAGWWGWDFYKLRNLIVHGDEVSLKKIIYKNRRYWRDKAGFHNLRPERTHMRVSDAIFGELIWWELFDMKFLGDSIRTLVDNHLQGSPEARSPIEKYRCFPNIQFDDPHESLGWKDNRKKRKRKI